MFNERDALRIRLEQLVLLEEKTLKMYREERNEIFNRLRELDENSVDHEELQKELPPKNVEEHAKEKGYHKKTMELRNATIEILKKHATSVQLRDLKKEIEKETGVELKNISLFMSNLLKKEENITKATHGQYMYVEK